MILVRHLTRLLACSAASLLFQTTIAQNTSPWPSTGSVGIGTTSPATLLEVKAGVDEASAGTQYIAPLVLGYTNDYGGGQAAQYILLIPAYGGTVGEAPAGMSGKLMVNRGTTGAYNSVYEYDVHAQTAYSASYVNIVPTSAQADVLNIYTVTYQGTPYLAILGSDLIYSGGLCTYTGYFWNSVNSVKPQIVLASACTNVSVFTSTAYLAGSNLTATASGYVGVGTPSPQVPLHVVGTGVSVDANNDFSGNLSIQANSSSRSTTSGAELEFVIPTKSDGTLPWGQGRIITVAGDSINGDAVGKMILGTRRYFNKLGTGNGWYYGNDITIDGSGNVGIGTKNPQSLLAVAGTVTAKQVAVSQTGWSDFVFDSTYQRMSLETVADYTRQYKHLPGIPSTAEIEQNGLDLGAMEKLHMQKIEELTLYAIEADKRIARDESEISDEKVLLSQQQALLLQLQAQLNAQQKEIDRLKAGHATHP